MIEVKFKVLESRHPELPLPSYAKPGDAGLDLYANEKGVIRGMNSAMGFAVPGGRKLVSTGLAFEIPPGYVGLVCPRSGLAVSNGITVGNAPGVIDSQFRGEVKVLLQNHSLNDFEFAVGDRIGQLVILPCSQVSLVWSESLSDTERGTGGFGSTGR